VTHIRVAAHVHSDWSYDGRWGLDAIATTFGRLGYDAVLLAEHDRGFDDDRWVAYREACAAARTSATLLIAGIEYSDPSNTVHIPVWGDIPFLGEGLPTADLLARTTAVEGFAVLAHLGRRSVGEHIDPEWLRHLHGLELWNRKYDGYAPNSVAARLLAEQPQLLPFVSLDFHTARQFHPLAMVIELDGELTESFVLAALRLGRARPTAFGLPALTLANGLPGPAMRGLERSRKRARQLAAWPKRS
jgi:hypothetical protein